MAYRGKWTEAALVNVIKEAYEKKGSKVYDKWLNNNGYSSPLSRIKKGLGLSLFDFANQNGVGHLVESRYTHGGYSEEYLVQRFKELYESVGEPLYPELLKRQGLNKLLVYIRAHYGGLDAFIAKHKLDSIFDKRYEVLTEEVVVQRIKDLAHSLGGKISIRHVQDELSGCSHYIYRNHGDFKTFCESNNILDIYDYRGGVKWNEELAREAVINTSMKYGCKVNLSMLNADKQYGLTHYIRNNFANTLDFVTKLNLGDYMQVSDFSTACSEGNYFEKLVRDSFNELGFMYEYHPSYFDGIVPDFYDSETNTIIDAKLSSYTPLNLNNNFFERYTAQCDRLLIIYLRGKPMLKKDNNIEFRHISYYYEDLISLGRTDLVCKFKSLMELAS